MSSTRLFGFVIACPRRMSIPNDDRTPQIFEKRNGLSSVTTVSSQSRLLAIERDVDVLGPDVARQPDVSVDRLGTGKLQVATGKPFQEARELRFARYRTGGAPATLRAQPGAGRSARRHSASVN